MKKPSYLQLQQDLATKEKKKEEEDKNISYILKQFKILNKLFSILIFLKIIFKTRKKIIILTSKF